MRKRGCFLAVASCFMFSFLAFGQTPTPADFPVKGFSIAAPSRVGIDSFVNFMNMELASRKINTLVLRIDYSFQYKSHPELVSPHALSLADVQKISAAAKKNNINIIPQVNLLGHQSWAGNTGKLLQVYPEFDETPWVKMPEKYVWPNADSLYCKSYCPLHPGVHKVVFDLVDELCDAFGATAFHAGMDEVFYIGMDKCPRCGGKSKAALFAGEVKLIRDHLAKKNRTLWIWGDRLLDGWTTGLGMWEASYNNTHTAVDLIPKDVVICDWHYERPDKTAVYFASKGFKVVTCPWNRPAVAVEQSTDLQRFRNQSTPEMSERFLGMMHTVWSDPTRFLQEFYYMKTDTAQKSTAETFKKTFPVSVR
jgi:N-acetyl-beta-hexosaminidase